MENTELNNEKKVGRHKVYTAEQLKERKKKYDSQYQLRRYNDDPEYRAYVIAKQHKYLNKIRE